MSASKKTAGFAVVVIIVALYVFLFMASAPAPNHQSTSGNIATKVVAKGIAASSAKSPSLASGFVNFMGQVNHPGPIPVPVGGLTLVQALTEAGGPTTSAVSHVDITRINSDGSTKVLKNVDLRGAVKGTAMDIPLQNGDTIFLGQNLLRGV